MIASTPTALESLRRDGFTAFRKLFPADLVARAREEVEEVCRHHVDPPASKLPEMMRVTRFEHFSFAVDLYGLSSGLEEMVERILTDPVTAAVLGETVGEHYKVRGFNVRRMLGTHDPLTGGPFSMPHSWHRDWKGEFGISILLSDVPPSNNAGTAFAPGSHLWPYDPRWNTLLSEWNVLGDAGFRSPFFRGLVRRMSFFNDRLGRKMLPGAVEATGAAGDVFFFSNDTWHGRFPNLHGRKTTVLFLGVFPTEFPFPDDVRVPPPAILDRLPPRFRRAVRHDQPVNERRDTLTHWILANQKPADWFGPFHLAHIERRAVLPLVLPLRVVNGFKRRLRKR